MSWGTLQHGVSWIDEDPETVQNLGGWSGWFVPIYPTIHWSNFGYQMPEDLPAFAPLSQRDHTPRCYQFKLVLDACRARAYEETQCRPAREDLYECQQAAKQLTYTRRFAWFTATQPWEERRRLYELQEAAMDRVQTDPRPLVERVREAQGRFDTSTAEFDFTRMMQSFWGAGGSHLQPRDFFDPAAPLQQPENTPGWGLNIFTKRVPHPMGDTRSMWQRALGLAGESPTFYLRERLGWHPDTGTPQSEILRAVSK
eukprot:TRINITY_DN68000_c0_g1_i1.p1 TRINITY_DN68000_c0_g1~~TRINITY_DN68000_c0_g1_i1.p1  ORF type:complete len:256 (-),score=32.79 TRINITY_DN68000_c0_g1_i1:129-896(-)